MKTIKNIRRFITFDKRIVSHFDFLIVLLLVPILGWSLFLMYELNEYLFQKQLIYYAVGAAAFFIMFFISWRRIKWLIPPIYWVMILLLVAVEFVGVTKLGAKRWLEIPLIGLTVQPSELIKPAFLLMMAYLIHDNPPGKKGYNLKEFAKLSFFILLPFALILKEPDLGTALIILIIGYGVLFIVGVNWKIWAAIFLALAVSSPFAYNSLHDYQKKRITDFIGEEPSYHVQQSIIAVGSGGLKGQDKDSSTQTHLNFLPIASSDFIFAYLSERFGFVGAMVLISIYAFLILHLFSIANYARDDYFLKVMALGLGFMIFLYMSINIAMTIGLAPVVGLPLPLFSHGGSSFLNFMVIFGILQNLLAFRFNFLYNSASKTNFK
ncbi:MAG: FtsW/RodA/SpoVE family cell cycle protein [Campylobacterota bacterium]